jgi:biotin/methionine sulfoxide reductase
MGVMPREVETSSHWGTYLVDVDDHGQVIGTRPHADDPDAAPAIANVTDAQHARARVARPALRRRWLENGPGPDDDRGRVRPLGARHRRLR